jgi:hypothetical protein
MTAIATDCSKHPMPQHTSEKVTDTPHSHTRGRTRDVSLLESRTSRWVSRSRRTGVRSPSV